jgi:hypothetical protein
MKRAGVAKQSFATPAGWGGLARLRGGLPFARPPGHFGKYMP